MPPGPSPRRPVPATARVYTVALTSPTSRSDAAPSRPDPSPPDPALTAVPGAPAPAAPRPCPGLGVSQCAGFSVVSSRPPGHGCRPVCVSPGSGKPGRSVPGGAVAGGAVGAAAVLVQRFFQPRRPSSSLSCFPTADPGLCVFARVGRGRDPARTPRAPERSAVGTTRSGHRRPRSCSVSGWSHDRVMRDLLSAAPPQAASRPVRPRPRRPHCVSRGSSGAVSAPRA